VADYEYDILFIDEIIKHVEDNRYEEVPQIRMYYLMYQLYTIDNGIDIYMQLKSEIFRNIESFPIGEAHDIINAALNFCISQINRGNESFRSEIFELYNYSLKKELIYINNEITPSTFRNIVVIALRLKEFNWAERFIEEYSKKLNLKYRDNIVRLNLSQIKFYKNRYHEVLDLLRSVDYEDITMNLQAKSILLATYYELDEYDPLSSFLNSFKVYLSRKNKLIPKSRLVNYNNLIRFTKKLISTPFTDKEALLKLKKQIEEEPSIASKAWLLEKLAEAGI
jgi:hypothetical protein